jgi:integrase
VISVDRKVAEVAGHLYTEAPKNRKRGRPSPLISPRPATRLTERVATRIEQARTEQHFGSNPLKLLFPSPHGKLWRSSNFNRNVLKRAYLAAEWRDEAGRRKRTWHSLRHVFCTTSLFTWGLDAADVSRMAGHANYRITLDMCAVSRRRRRPRPRPPGDRLTLPRHSEGPANAHMKRPVKLLHYIS